MVQGQLRVVSAARSLGRVVGLLATLVVGACGDDSATSDATSEGDVGTGASADATTGAASEGATTTSAGSGSTSGVMPDLPPLDDHCPNPSQYPPWGEVPEPAPPAFVTTNYFPLDQIGWVSKFRSGVGHDYSDDHESCRSMKHYFYPFDELDWSSVEIRSPVAGRVLETEEEWAGTRVVIESSEFPEIRFTLFHVALLVPLADEVTLGEGEVIGVHVGEQTFMDIAVAVHADGDWRLISYFDVMADSLWSEYAARGGVSSRADLIITRAQRDAEPLCCTEGQFDENAPPEDWVALDPGDEPSPPSSPESWKMPYEAPLIEGPRPHDGPSETAEVRVGARTRGLA